MATSGSGTESGMVTDAVTQTNVSVVADAPAMALGTTYQSVAHSTGLSFEAAVNSQNQQFMTGLASGTQGVMQIMSVDSIDDALAIAKMLQ